MTGWLLDTLLYTGLLIGVVLVLRRPVGRFFGPQLAYCLWALPFLRLWLPPVTLPASFAPEVAQAPVSAAEWVPAAIDAPIEVAAAAMPVVAAAPVTTTVTVTAAPPPSWEWTDLIAPAASVWAGVALAFLIYRVVTYQRMRRELLKDALPMGEIGKVRLVETPALAAPVAFGVLDKVIALPPLFMAQPDLAGRDLAIAHELAHHRGHDLLANFAAQALLALHWFNPLAWYGWRAMRRDQEAACDARVLAGRSWDDRLRYASLIAGIATGPRLALAAPMACPILGERSIVHRLRSLSMSETSRRRRWFGRSLIATGALALPLTASISYAANAQDEPPATPVAPVPPTPETAPVPPTAPVAPEVTHDGERRVHTIITRVGPDGEPVVREFSWRGPPNVPNPPHFEWNGDWDNEEFQAKMEEFQRQMEKFGEEQGANQQNWEQFGRQWEQWGQEHAEQMRQLGEQHRAQALAMAEQAQRIAPHVVMSCDGATADNPTRTESTDDGRQRIVICNKMVNRQARNSLRRARESIANNSEINPEVRNEVLLDLDREIERIERQDD